MRDLSVEIARAIGLDRNKIRVIAIAATLHDVGKISTPDRVLLKPGPLTDEEYEIMKQHAPNGAQILRGIRSLPEGVEPMVRHHHERWDGKGYPDGLAGNDISLQSRMLAILDAYDALRNKRSYKPAWSLEETVETLKNAAGKQFDPALIDLFLKHVDRFEGIQNQYAG